MTAELKLKVIRWFFRIMAIFLFGWWPVSHWIFSDFYHSLLGFEPGSYQDNLVKIIGTSGMLPVLLLILAALDPLQNRHTVIVLIIFFFLMSLTFLFLILTQQLPLREYINVGLSAFSAFFLCYFYPWNYKDLSYLE